MQQAVNITTKRKANKEAIYIGVDGGGTKSKLVMRDSANNIIGTGRAGASNIRLSVDKSIASIMSAFNQACVQASRIKDLSQCEFHLGLGLAGTELPTSRTEFLAKLPDSFASVCLKSDAYAACLGAHNGADGAILIIGTGVVGYKINAGQEQQVSGWGFPHDDQGGGAWLGMETVRYALEAQDGRRSDSPLIAAIMAQFNHDHTAFVTWANRATATEFATLAPMFTKYLVEGDSTAQALAKRAGSALTQVVHALLATEAQSSAKLDLCLFGGLSSFMEPYLPLAIQQRIQPRMHDAAEGALMMIQQQVKSL